MSNNAPATTNPTPAPLGGYAITGYKAIEMGCGVAFSGTITKDGEKVLTVENEGRGGCNRYSGVGTDWTGWREAEVAFEDFAKEWNAGSEYAGFEDGDALTEHLIEVAILNKKRVVVFLIDNDDYFGAGTAHQMKSGVTYEQAVAYIAAQYKGRNARIWNKARSEFVPVEGEGR